MPEHRRYKVTDDRFGRLALTLRERAGLTQAEMASAVGVSERSVQQWEAGVAYPAADNLKKLVTVYLHNGAFVPGRERDEAHALWEQVAESAARHKALFDEAWFGSLLAQQPLAQPNGATSPSARRDPSSPPLPRHTDWGEAPDAAVVYGRERELDMLSQWVLTERCRVVAVLGIGGIGKTTLAVRCAQALAPRFAFVVWRSLRNAPPLAELLADCLHNLAEQPSPDLPHSVERSITLLIDRLRTRRCLLILDDVDTLLEAGSLAGRYRAGYEGYRQLFQRIAETGHQSCLLLTSREMLSELEPLEGTRAPVRALKLSGLARAASQELLRDKDLFGAPAAWDVFTQHYAGTPLALKIAAATVRDLFGGDLAAFVREGPMTLHTLQQILDDQFERLSPLERDVLTWLAIERDMVALDELSADFMGTVLKKDLLTALKSLRRRSLVERDERGAAFTLQPVVLEHVSDWLVAQVGDEIIHGTFGLINKYALMKAQSKDYIRESQIRMIVRSLLNRLLAHFGDAPRIERRLLLLARRLREQTDVIQGYAGGNLVNLLVCLRGDLRGADCSHLVLRQAYLRGIEAQDASFAGADVGDTFFTEPLETIAAMTLSPNGEYLAVGSFSGQIRVWQVATGKPLWAVKGHTRMAWAPAFSPDGTLLASGGYQGRVKLWDVASGRCLKTFQGHSKWVRTVAFGPDGDTLVSAGDDATVLVWDIRDGACLRVLHGHVGLIWSVAVSPDGTLLVSSGNDGTVRVWDMQAGICLSTLKQHTRGVLVVAFHPHGAMFASGGEDGQISLWDAHSGRCLKTLQRQATGTVSIAFNPEGTLLASGGNDGVVELWGIGDEPPRNYLGRLQGHLKLVSSVAFAAHGLLASVAYGGQVKLWEVASGKCLRTIQGYSRLITAITFSPDGRLLAQGDDNGMLRVWELLNGRCLTAVQGHSGPVWALAFSPDGTTLASGGDDGSVKLWQPRNGQCLKTYSGHTVVVWAVAFSPNGSVLASGGADREIKLWETRPGSDATDPRTLRGSTDWIWSLAFDPAGHVLASGHANGDVKLWNAENGQCLKTVRHTASSVGALHLSADGQTLISSSNDDVLRWLDVASGQCLKTVPEHAVGNWVKAVAFSQDGQLLATGSDDQTVQLWRVEQGSDAHRAARLTGHMGQIWAVALSPDHLLLASADDQGTTLVWDTQTCAVLRRLTTDRPYERMNIHGIKGINAAQRAALKALGAVEETVPSSELLA